ncbi:hypothetical protein TNCV_2682801 [Trichonephila clavipes]|nr:hypothetical protein TNCV_2682801 [Trichonephila clavipes]
MGKMPDLDVFDRRQIVGARRMDHSISEIIRQLESPRSTMPRVYLEYTWMVDETLAIGQIKRLCSARFAVWVSRVSTYESTIAQCSGCMSCFSKRAQRLECSGLEMSSME